MDELRTPLETISSRVRGTFAVTIMGVDGLPVDNVEAAHDEELDVNALLVEYCALMDQVKRAAQMFAAGQLDELSVRTERLVAVLRPITDEYYLVLAMRPEANIGMGRYLVRVHAPKLADALS